jgi:hypothetical protein
MAGATIGVLCVVAMCDGRWWPADQLRVEGRWRLAAALVLIFVLPFIGPYIGMRSSLRIFLKVYALPLAAVTLAWLAAVRLRVRKSESKRIEI